MKIQKADYGRPILPATPAEIATVLHEALDRARKRHGPLEGAERVLARAERAVHRLATWHRLAGEFNRGNLTAGQDLVVLLAQSAPAARSEWPLTTPPAADRRRIEARVGTACSEEHRELLPGPAVGEIYRALMELTGVTEDLSKMGPMFGTFAALVDGTMEEAGLAELLYRRAHAGLRDEQELQRFSELIGGLDPEKPRPGPLGPPGISFPFPSLPMWLEHLLWTAERRAEQGMIVRCLLALKVEGKRYRIDAIDNRTHNQRRLGCPGDTVEIRGENFGDDGDLYFFPRVRGQTTSWSDTEIIATIPEGAEAGDVRVCTHPNDVPLCQGVNACRPAAADNEPLFTVVPPPTILEFTLNGEDGTTGPIELEAGSSTRIRVVADAQQVVIRRSPDDVLADYREVLYGRIDETFDIVGGTQDESFVIEASTLCGVESKTLDVTRYLAVHVEAPYEIELGVEYDLTIRVSVPVSNGSLDVQLSVTSGDLSVPPSVTIPAGTDRNRVRQPALGTCGEVRIEGSAPGHRPGQAVLLLYDAPVVTGVSPVENGACGTVVLTIEGHCFPLNQANVAVELQKGAEVAPLTVASVSGRQGDGLNTQIEARGNGLALGIWNIVVLDTQHGLTSGGGVTMEAVPPVPSIIDFAAATALPGVPSIIACQDNTVTFSWKVRSANRVEIRDPEGNLMKEFQYGENCGDHTGSYTTQIRNRGHYRLEATGIGGGETREREVEIFEVATTNAFRYGNGILIINNPQGSGHTLDIFRWSAGAEVESVATLSDGESKIVDDLTNCVQYRFTAKRGAILVAEIPIYIHREEIASPFVWNLPAAPL